MQEESSVYEGVLDVSILVPVCYSNPLTEDSINFLQDVLLQRRKALVPITTLVGAYHIVTNYLGVSRLSTKNILSDLLRTGSEAFYPKVTADLVMKGLEFAATYGIESWDGYLIALAKKFGARVLFSMDEELGESLKLQKEAGLPAVVNPFPAKKVHEYHSFLEKKT
jgi:predicted nucleic acid-binding protein